MRRSFPVPQLVNLHAAAGTGNAMGKLTSAQSGHVPVVITFGQQARRYTEVNTMLTNVDAPTLAAPLVKWRHEPSRPQDIPQALSKGLLRRTACAWSCPGCGGATASGTSTQAMRYRFRPGEFVHRLAGMLHHDGRWPTPPRPRSSR